MPVTVASVVDWTVEEDEAFAGAEEEAGWLEGEPAPPPAFEHVPPVHFV